MAIAAQHSRVSGSELSPELIALRTAGWDAAYRTDYQTARARFAALLQKAPNHPDGDLSMAAIVWQEYLFQTRRLQSNIYHRDSNFYAGARTSTEKSEGDKVEAAVSKAFQDYIGQALSKAQALADANPNDPSALYFLGSAYGVRAAYEASAERRFWAALRDGVKSVKLHQKVVELDPAYYDAYLTLGTYHYVIGCIPRPFRLIATMMGIHGGKRKGLAELEMATKKSVYNQDDARSVLIAVYRYENNPQQALAELEVLSKKYPENLLLRIEMASTLAQQRSPAAAAAIFEALLQGPDRRLMDLVQFQYAEALALSRAYEDAAKRFASIERIPNADPGLATQAMIRAGQMYDLAGRRPEAVRMYRASLAAHPDSSDLRKLVEGFIRQPFTLK